MLTPGIPGPMVLCGGLIPPPKFWGDKQSPSESLWESFWKIKVGGCKEETADVIIETIEASLILMDWFDTTFKDFF